MLVSDLLHSCANDRVAEAAVSSIGGPFALEIQSAADDGGLTVGRYAARIVRDFAVAASERDWRDLALSVRGQDHPVLAGLQLILERRVATPNAHRRRGDAIVSRAVGHSGIAVAAA